MKGDIVVIPEGEHSELGPSSAERWINCMGSVLPSRGVVIDPSDYALEGTAAHTVSEWVRKHGVPAQTFYGTTLRITHGEQHWDVFCGKPMVRAVQEFCDRVAVVPGHELVEARVTYTDVLFGPPWSWTGDEVPAFGTSDSVKLTDNACYVGDFKYGKGVKKDADMNEQLLLYAFGTYVGWRHLYDFDTFVLDIYQPRLNHFDRAEILLARLIDWVGDVAAPAARRSLRPGAPLRAGSWCQFCKIKPTCAVHAEYRQQRENVARQNDVELIGDLS